MIDLATKSMLYDSHLMLTLDCSALANSHYLYVNVPLEGKHQMMEQPLT